MFLVPASLLGEALRPSDKPADAATQNAVVAFYIDRVNVCVGRVAENFSPVLINKFSPIDDFHELPVDYGIFSEMVEQGSGVLYISISIHLKFLSECGKLKNCAHLPNDMIGDHVESFTDGVSDV